MSNWYMYVLRCGDDSFYTGMTNDVERRFSEHAAGRGGRYTRAHLPVTLIGVWEYADRAEAMRAEASFKTLTHADKAHRIHAREAFRDGSFVPELLKMIESADSRC